MGIAVIDSGIDKEVKDVDKRVAYSENFLIDKDDKKRNEGKHDYGHGTHIAGIIAGNAKNSSGKNTLKTFKGLAPGCALDQSQGSR